MQDEKRITIVETTTTVHEYGTTTSYRVRYAGPSLGAALAHVAANDPGPTPDLDVPPETVTGSSYTPPKTESLPF